MKFDFISRKSSAFTGHSTCASAFMKKLQYKLSIVYNLY
uniref:Uncharacterized protein n=1 Tax=Rhizophora mucronata TaxID=61149 RepID=A0A2P2Q9W6_RHIMU